MSAPNGEGRVRRLLITYARSLIGIVAGFLVMIATGALRGSQALSFLLIAPLVLLGGWLVGRRGALDPGWQPLQAFEFVPAAAHVASPPRAVAAALGRVEARELSASGPFGVGVGFSLVVVGTFGWVWAEDMGGELAQLAELAPSLAHPLVGMSLVAAFGARTRSRRDDTQELFEACPTSEATRTAGHLRTAWVAVAVGVACLVLALGMAAASSNVVWGPMGARQAGHLAGSAVLLAGGVALGVALARWLPWRITPIVAVVLVGMLSINLATRMSGEGRPVNGLRQLSTFLGDPELPLRFTAPHWVAHHLWLAGLSAVVAVLALARDRRTPALWAAGGAAAAVAVVAGVLAVQPIDGADARRIAALLADPAAHQTCIGTTVAVCVYEGDEDLARYFEPDIAAVAGVLPAEGPAGLAFRGDGGVDRLKLDPEIDVLLPERIGVGALPVDLQAVREAALGVRFWTALAAVGAVDDTYREGPAVDLRGQARGVVAVWAAVQGLGERETASMTSTDPDPHDGPGRPWPDSCYAGVAPVQWALTDLAAARALVAAPAGDVEAVVRDNWDAIRDPGTTTDELLALLGFEPIGRPEGATARSAC